MNDLKQAYELLSLTEGASKEEVEKRYFILLRRDRSNKQREADEHDDSPSLEEINRAYRLILGHEDEKTMAKYNEASYGKYKKMGPTFQKIDHFFSYYKFHVLGVIVLIIAIIYGINAYINHRHEQAELAKLPPVDVSVSFFGDYFNSDGTFQNSDMKPFETKFVSQFPQWKRVEAFFTYVPQEMQSQQDSALMQKSIIDLMMNKADVYILDKPNFVKLAQDGSLLPLDGDAASKMGFTFKPESAFKTVTQDDPTLHVYGVDIAGSTLLKELPVIGKEYIAAIRINGDHHDNAFTFIEKYVNSVPAK
ncbi:J domain-containing protein [Paenibacillus albus]|uniref:J domain-containing protein n=1 Tax=Paenibacillus albus TaxID=2495582 RepID=A0A3S9AAH3_9BACL|nr:J domain-containing protein [Paenibacillus albus]AZN42758.1 J domain-containing protein [Paenibacillus albus]